MEYPINIDISEKLFLMAVGGFKIYRLNEYTFFVINEEGDFKQIYTDIHIVEIVERIEELYRSHFSQEFESIVEYPAEPEPSES